MSDDIDNWFEQLYSELERPSTPPLHYDMAVQLGEFWNCVEHASSPYRVKEYWRSRVVERYNKIVDPEMLALDLDERFRNLHRIVSVGSKFVFEEIAAVLSERIEVDLVLGLPEIGIEVNKVLLQEIDEEIEEIASSFRNRSAFRSARTSVRKNWGKPIRHALLES